MEIMVPATDVPRAEMAYAKATVKAGKRNDDDGLTSSSCQGYLVRRTIRAFWWMNAAGVEGADGGDEQANNVYIDELHRCAHG